MKFNELKSKVEKLNSGMNNRYFARQDNEQTALADDFFEYYQISEAFVGSVLQTPNIESISEHDRLALQKLAYKYSRTPLDERRDEPKFRVRMLPDDVDGYLNQSTDTKHLFVANDEDLPWNKTIYTKSEYEQLQKVYSKWLAKFDEDDPHFEFLEDEK
ncbi:hypothetical protein [Lentilactobacillus hilgardii]|uniref:hypothetical protein n=2 Tax=Lactobacillales TaxID=186826 RepID=UPI0039EA9BB4